MSGVSLFILRIWNLENGGPDAVICLQCCGPEYVQNTTTPEDIR